jgi:lipoprotein signal peptidase
LLPADTPGTDRLSIEGAALAGRFRLVLLVAVLVIVVDHAAKLAAAGLQPADYLHNPSPFVYDWVLLLPFALLLIPSRLIAVLLAVWFGGSASNTIDLYVWPGGVPDFIPMGDWVWNPADFAIYGAGIPLMLSVVLWPTWKLFCIARRKYPEPLPAAGPSGRSSHGVLDREELPFETEVLRQPLRERLYAEPLGRVVTAREEVDPELA